MYKNISPHLNVFATLVTALLSLYVFYTTGFSGNYFFMPIFALALVYAGINLVRQYQGLSPFTIHKTAG